MRRPALLQLEEAVECACRGVMACSTCPVSVDEAWRARVGEPPEEEEDMLDLAFELTDTSRLGCQIKVTKELDGMVAKVPSM